jgi:hypothetical protein
LAPGQEIRTARVKMFEIHASVLGSIECTCAAKFARPQTCILDRCTATTATSVPERIRALISVSAQHQPQHTNMMQQTLRFVLVLAACVAASASDALAEMRVELGAAGDYVILAKTGISTVPASAIIGDIAVSPIDGTAMTGFSFTDGKDETHKVSSQVTGKAFAANYASPTPSLLTTAVNDMETAYTDAAGRANPDGARINIGAGTLGGVNPGGPTTPLTAGVYTFGSDVGITANLHFTGNQHSIFIIQVTGNVVQAANYQVTLESDGTDGGSKVKPENIFWQIAGYVSIGAGAHMEGTLLVKTHVAFTTGSSLLGRVFTQTACTVQKATITQPF